jgi:hypothetical protein
MNPLDERLRKEAKNYNDAKPAPRDSIELAYYDGAKLYAERCEQLEAEVRDLVEAQKSLMTIAAKVEAERDDLRRKLEIAVAALTAIQDECSPINRECVRGYKIACEALEKIK